MAGNLERAMVIENAKLCLTCLLELLNFSITIMNLSVTLHWSKGFVKHESLKMWLDHQKYLILPMIKLDYNIHIVAVNHLKIFLTSCIYREQCVVSYNTAIK